MLYITWQIILILVELRAAITMEGRPERSGETADFPLFRSIDTRKLTGPALYGRRISNDGGFG